MLSFLKVIYYIICVFYYITMFNWIGYKICIGNQY